MEQTASSNEPVTIIDATPSKGFSEAEKEEYDVNPAFLIKKHLTKIYLRLDQLEAKIEKCVLTTTQKTEILNRTKLSVQEFREFIDLLNETLIDALPAGAVTPEDSTLKMPSKNTVAQRKIITTRNVEPQQIQGNETTTGSLHPTILGSRTRHQNLTLAHAGGVFAKSDEVTTVIGDAEVPSGTTINKNIAVKGALTIGDNCRIHGNLEALKDVTIGADTIINGDLASGGNVLMGPRSLVNGSVEAAGVFEIEDNAVVEGARIQTPEQ